MRAAGAQAQRPGAGVGLELEVAEVGHDDGVDGGGAARAQH